MAHSKYLSDNPQVMAITAIAFGEEGDEALSKGMDCFITKPIPFKVLVQNFKKYLPHLFIAGTSF